MFTGVLSFWDFDPQPPWVAWSLGFGLKQDSAPHPQISPECCFWLQRTQTRLAPGVRCSYAGTGFRNIGSPAFGMKRKPPLGRTELLEPDAVKKATHSWSLLLTIKENGGSAVRSGDFRYHVGFWGQSLPSLPKSRDWRRWTRFVACDFYFADLDVRNWWVLRKQRGLIKRSFGMSFRETTKKDHVFH